jgi:UDP-N-acetylglucosamine 1-carboxyvinyltransferase
MEKLVVEGGVPLRGAVDVRGSKNAALPILFATLLSGERCVIRNVPHLKDVTTTMDILGQLGMRCERSDDGSIVTELDAPELITAPYEYVSRMRASICSLGPLLARRKRAKVAMPGGCQIGVRPIDLHLKGLRELGARIDEKHGYIEAEADELRGATVYLGGPFGSTVLGTANVMMAAVLARGTTVIQAAACEPEIVDLADFLNTMGAKVRGAGTPRVVIEGVDELGGADHTVIADRIEAGTLLIAGAITRGDVIVRGAEVEHLAALLDVLKKAGVRIESGADWARVFTNGAFRPVDVTTLPYPGFPTDLQAQVMSLLSLADGISIVVEKVYPDRFFHIAELARMGAQIRKEGSFAVISGVKRLSGAPVKASDLRASACLILAGLVASGTTEVHAIHHLDRGYEKIEERLCSLGALVRREAETELEPTDAIAALA